MEIKNKFKKKGFDYFGTLVKMSEYALEEAKFLKEILSDYRPDQLKDNHLKMHEMEHACDMEKHSLTQALVKEFLPPVDRDDLFKLSHLTDNVTDWLESIPANFYMMGISSVRPDVTEFADLAIECCQLVKDMLVEFANFKRSTELKGIVIRLNDKEEQGDRLYESSMRTLSENASSVRELVEWRAIYKRFEDFYDSAESLADNVEMIVMKNT